MELDQLFQNYPRLFHMAEEGTWEMIKLHGLLSTSALLDHFEINGARKEVIEARHRPQSVEISHPRLGTAIVRDQKPMSDGGLARALSGSGITPHDWYKLLNGKVFFWLTRERLLRLLGAAEYRRRPHTVLTLDTKTMVQANRKATRLSPINSGCTKPFPHPRGHATFLPIEDFPFDERRATRSLSNAVVELTVELLGPNIQEFTLLVEEMQGRERRSVIFER